MYQAVWAKPISHLVEGWEIKGAEIQHWCRERHISMPEQGHWCGLKFEKDSRQTPLPEFDETAETVVDQDSRQVIDPPPVFPGEKELSFRVPDRLIHPKKPIMEAEKSLTKQRYDQMQRSDDG